MHVESKQQKIISAGFLVPVHGDMLGSCHINRAIIEKVVDGLAPADKSTTAIIAVATALQSQDFNTTKHSLTPAVKLDGPLDVTLPDKFPYDLPASLSVDGRIMKVPK